MITAVVTATRKGYEPSTVTTAPTEPVLGGAVQVTEPFELSGVPRLGSELSIVPGSFQPATAEVGYTWLRDGIAIPGALAPTYVPTDVDVGSQLSVRVRVRKPGFKPAYTWTGKTPGIRSVPQLQVSSVGGPERARVAVTVTAPGSTWRGAGSPCGSGPACARSTCSRASGPSSSVTSRSVCAGSSSATSDRGSSTAACSGARSA